MELLESQDPRKKKLIESSDRYKRELEREVKAITEKTERTMKNALIIGGTLVLTYVLVSQLSASSKKKKKRKQKIKVIRPVVEKQAAEEEEEDDDQPSFAMPAVISQVGTQVLSQASFILLELAKEKLMDFLQSRNKKEDENS
ncbi:MAG: hypothetical protein DI538_02400 [Azospira oryzae]|jgi:hypothetical protein|nr:hypothetical protein [Cytophaga sp.]PZR41061.1 MAG: hypothetical protein DI538_02400 [Azospira oryzae]